MARLPAWVPNGKDNDFINKITELDAKMAYDYSSLTDAELKWLSQRSTCTNKDVYDTMDKNLQLGFGSGFKAGALALLIPGAIIVAIPLLSKGLIKLTEKIKNKQSKEKIVDVKSTDK